VRLYHTGWNEDPTTSDDPRIGLNIYMDLLFLSILTSFFVTIRTCFHPADYLAFKPYLFESNCFHTSDVHIRGIRLGNLHQPPRNEVPKSNYYACPRPRHIHLFGRTNSHARGHNAKHRSLRLVSSCLAPLFLLCTPNETFTTLPSRPQSGPEHMANTPPASPSTKPPLAPLTPAARSSSVFLLVGPTACR
jgi:hypothetical protein